MVAAGLFTFETPILPIILLHGITFVWILIFQCAKKAPNNDAKKPSKKSQMKPASTMKEVPDKSKATA